MEEERNRNIKDEIADLSNELTYRRDIMNKEQMRTIFREMKLAE